MSRILKILMVLMAAVMALVIVAMVYLTQLFDPNSFRGDIEALARDQGVPLTLSGPIEWQWYPRLGLRAEDVAVSAAEQSLFSAQTLAAQVAVAPLLKGQIVVAGVELEGVELFLQVDGEGRGNWQALIDQGKGESAERQSDTGRAPEVAASASSATVTSPLNLAINQLQLSRVSVVYRDLRQDLAVRAQVPDCLMTGFNLQGSPFDIRCKTTLQWQQYPQIQVETLGQLGFDRQRQELKIVALQETLRLADETVTVRSHGSFELTGQQLDAHLEVEQFNPRAWLQALAIELPDMADHQAFTRLSLAGDVSSDGSQWQVQQMRVGLDDSLLQGSISQSAERTLALLLHGDQLNLDRYLPSPSQAQPAAGNGGAVKKPKTGPSEAVAVDSRRLSNEPLPLAAIEGLSVHLALGLEAFQASGVQMQDLELEATAHQGLVELSSLAVNLYEGSAKAQARLDTRSQTPELSVSSQVQGVQLQPLLMALADEQRLMGVSSLDLAVKAKGESLAAWQRTAKGTLQLQAETLAVNELDIEKSFCEIAALVAGKPAPQLDWKNKTDLQQVLVNLHLNGTQAKFSSLQAGIEELQLGATGVAEYLSGDFDLRGDLRVTGAASPDRVCQVRDRWRNRDLPLRCKGNIDKPLSGKVCGPDMARFNKLLEDEAKGRLQEKLQEKIQEKFKDGDAEQVETLLRGLFGR